MKISIGQVPSPLMLADFFFSFFNTCEGTLYKTQWFLLLFSFYFHFQFFYFYPASFSYALSPFLLCAEFCLHQWLVYIHLIY